MTDRPFLPCTRVASYFRRSKLIEQGVVRGIHRNELTLQMRGQLCHLNAVLIQGCGYIIAIRFAFSRLSQIEKSSVPTWYLHAFETEISGPFGYAVQTVEWRVIAGELRH